MDTCLLLSWPHTQSASKSSNTFLRSLSSASASSLHPTPLCPYNSGLRPLQLDRHSSLGTQLPASGLSLLQSTPPSLPPVSFHPSICPSIHPFTHPPINTHPSTFLSSHPPGIHPFIPQCPGHFPYVTLCARHLISHLPKLQIHSPDGLQEHPITPRLSPRFLSSAHSGATQTCFCLPLSPSLHSYHLHSGSGPLVFCRTKPCCSQPMLPTASAAQSASPYRNTPSLQLSPHWGGACPSCAPLLGPHLCPAWLILLEQRQELAKLRRRSSLPEDEGDGKE